ncbi:uncharacterized protein LOC128932494 isoform X2 [Callithrix jacchus]
MFSVQFAESIPEDRVHRCILRLVTAAAGSPTGPVLDLSPLETLLWPFQGRQQEMQGGHQEKVESGSASNVLMTLWERGEEPCSGRTGLHQSRSPQVREPGERSLQPVTAQQHGVHHPAFRQTMMIASTLWSSCMGLQQACSREVLVHAALLPFL